SGAFERGFTRLPGALDGLTRIRGKVAVKAGTAIAAQECGRRAIGTDLLRLATRAGAVGKVAIKTGRAAIELPTRAALLHVDVTEDAFVLLAARRELVGAGRLFAIGVRL